MMKKKKNKLFTLIFSFMPGAAEMYMGFMRTGISLMGLFLFCTFAVMSMGQSVWFFLPVLIWFYSFFHARNLVAAEEEEFQKLEDNFIWTAFMSESNIQISNPTLRKWGAYSLIICGAMLLWENVSRIIYRMIPDSMWDFIAPIVDKIPEIVVAVLIIYIGIQMIRGKKEELDGDDN